MTAKIGDRDSFYDPDHKEPDQQEKKRPLTSRKIEVARYVFIHHEGPEVKVGYGKDPRLQNIIRRHLLER
jgi:hypothetical protein